MIAPTIFTDETVLPCDQCGGAYAPVYTAPMTGAAVRRCLDCGSVCAGWDDGDMIEP